MRQFYKVFNDEKVSAMLTQLSWSHYLELIPLKNINAINYYINLAINQNLNYRQLHEKVKNKEYERLDEITKKKLINDEKTKISDFVKNPIFVRNIYDYKEISEKILKQLILEDLDNFMKELGDDFSYVGNEYKIKLGNRYNYIDLLFYNIKFKCYVVIELKITELKKEHIGQIQTYMNYIDKNLKTINEDKTIGIIIIKKNDKYIMEYCSDRRILTREYNFI